MFVMRTLKKSICQKFQVTNIAKIIDFRGPENAQHFHDIMEFLSMLGNFYKLDI